MAQDALAHSPQPSALGGWLFRFRSFTPVPLLLVAAWRLAASRSSPGLGGDAATAVLLPLGWALAAAGEGLRFWTLGQVRDGTSGQGRVLEARELNAHGPYAHVRNPLYVGNLGICLGLMLLANDLWVYLLGLGFFFGQYAFIIRAEEAFLSERFGAAYADYRARVRRWVPSLRPAYPPGPPRRFDWRRALKKEHNPTAAWVLGGLLLMGWSGVARGTLSTEGKALLLGAGALTLVFFGVIKALKRGLIGRWVR